MPVNTDPWQVAQPDHEETVEQHNCYNCGQNNSDTWYTTSRGELCEDCGCICADCDNPFNMESGSPHANTGSGIACYRCTRLHYFVCNHCDEWVANDYERSTLSGTACDSCVESSFWYCDDCDNYVPDHWEHDECMTSNLIHPYDYKPTPIFNHLDSEFENAKIVLEDSNSVMRKYRKMPYLGFELEVECSGDRDDYRAGIEMLKDYDDVWYLKSDGSLNYGFELVSHPMTLDWAMNNLDFDLISRLSEHSFDAWNASTAGFHVHVSRDGFESESHQAKFVHFVMRNERFLSWLAGRSSSRWASFNREHTQNLKHKLRNRGASDRYHAVNLQNSGTLEVRIFRASYKPERIQMALQLVDAIVRYTEKLSVSEMVTGKGFTANSFITWVSADVRYAVLTDYITRWIEPFESGSQQIGE